MSVAIRSEKISIITACYNASTTIRDSIESILSQTYDNIEHVIVDGASSDNTIDIINSYKDRYNSQCIELVLISEKDSGIQDAYNKGVHSATGDWLIFINSGDLLYDSSVLSNAINSRRDKATDVLYGDIELFFHKRNERRIFSYPDIIDIAFLKRQTICHQSILFKRQLFIEYGNYDCSFKIASDFDRILVFFLAGAVYQHVPFVISTFVDDGVSTINFKKSILERLDILEKRIIKVGLGVYIRHYTLIVLIALKRQFIEFSNFVRK